jgi:hypothetical protein
MRLVGHELPMYTVFQVENLRGKDHSGDVDVRGITAE